MKLARLGPIGEERPGRDLDRRTTVPSTSSRLTADIDGAFFASAARPACAAALDAGSLPRSTAPRGLRVGAPDRPAERGDLHRHELRRARRRVRVRAAGRVPVIFLKTPNTVAGPYDDVHDPAAAAPRPTGRSSWGS